MIRCAAMDCERQWFHFECTNPRLQEAPDEDWFCSQGCRSSTRYIFCYCHMHKPDDKDMVQCELGENCRWAEWYHPSCLPFAVQALPG